ncbi:hypothetical protein SCALM49S_09591 [Streptomyces californicus]
MLASYGATSYRLMTAMLLVLGTSYVVTAHALRRAAPAGRLALAGGGLSALALTLVPAPSSGGALEHGAVATVDSRCSRSGRPWPPSAPKGRRPGGLRLDVSLAASAVMFASALWFLAELQSARAPGTAERVVTFLQALWPFLVVLSCRRSTST